MGSFKSPHNHKINKNSIYIKGQSMGSFKSPHNHKINISLKPPHAGGGAAEERSLSS